MAFANSKWRELYDKVIVLYNQPLDLTTILWFFNTELPLNKVGKPFRFESFWVTEKGCKAVVKDSWS